jgi:hypothetical protein
MAMKFVFGILLLVLISYLVGFFLPQSYEVTRSVVIAGPREEIQATLQDVSTWKDWSAFVPGGEAEQMVTSKYEGPVSGPGAIWIWGQDLADKPARLEVLTSGAWGITYLLELDGGRVESSGDISLERSDAGTLVTFVNGGELASPWRRYFALVANKAVGPALSQSLDGLKVHIEEGRNVPGGADANQIEPAKSGAGEAQPKVVESVGTSGQ